MTQEEYVRGLIAPDEGVLAQQREFALTNNIPVLLPEAANLLKLMSAAVKPAKILEIGTAIGYSGLLMLLNSSAELTTVELDEASLDLARKFFAQAEVLSRVTAHLGDAKMIVPMLSGNYGLIFLDGPKSNYIDFLPYLYNMLEQGGILICDNVLFKGWISGQNEPPKHKHNTIIRKLDAFCRAISTHEGLITSILPIGDGISISYKKPDKG